MHKNYKNTTHASSAPASSAPLPRVYPTFRPPHTENGMPPTYQSTTDRMVQSEVAPHYSETTQHAASNQYHSYNAPNGNIMEQFNMTTTHTSTQPEPITFTRNPSERYLPMPLEPEIPHMQTTQLPPLLDRMETQVQQHNNHRHTYGHQFSHHGHQQTESGQSPQHHRSAYMHSYGPEPGMQSNYNNLVPPLTPLPSLIRSFEDPLYQPPNASLLPPLINPLHMLADTIEDDRPSHLRPHPELIPIFHGPTNRPDLVMGHHSGDQHNDRREESSPKSRPTRNTRTNTRRPAMVPDPIIPRPRRTARVSRTARVTRASVRRANRPRAPQEPDNLGQLGTQPNHKGAGGTLHCTECSEDFPDLRARDNHVRTIHHRDHGCHICVSRFKTRSDKNRHIRIVHERMRPYPCDECDARFSEKNKLRRHKETVHQKLRPFRCPVCRISFGELGNLRQHCSSIHTDYRINLDEIRQVAKDTRSLA